MCLTKENIKYETVKNEPLKLSEVSVRKYEMEYFMFFCLLFTHAAALYGTHLALHTAKWMTLLFAYCTLVLSMTGVIAGAHRLWSHRAYKARRPLEIFLMLCFSMACQFTVHRWVKLHRVHHKYSDTDADPHNANRGFFFSHIGWSFVRAHPEVKRRMAEVCIDDLRSNPVLEYHRRHYRWLLPTACYVIPTLIPVLVWNEDLSTSWHVNVLRHLISLHVSSSVNSFAHLWGSRPYDAGIKACQSLAVVLLTGEGFHNYHHAFPYDYRSADVGNYKLNFMTMFVDACAALGLAYELRTAPAAAVRRRMLRAGDGSDLWGRRN